MKSPQALLAKAEEIKKENPLDLSKDEDLAVGVMNLISIEEHLFFTIEKTGQEKYLELLNDVRKLRIDAYRRLVEDPEGEVWCIGKHLLAASMRFMEVGTKNLKEGKGGEAKVFFDQGFELFSMFWRLKTGNLRSDKLKNAGDFSTLSRHSEINSAVNWVKKKLDCCRE